MGSESTLPKPTSVGDLPGSAIPPWSSRSLTAFPSTAPLAGLTVVELWRRDGTSL